MSKNKNDTYLHELIRRRHGSNGIRAFNDGYWSPNNPKKLEETLKKIEELEKEYQRWEKKATELEDPRTVLARRKKNRMEASKKTREERKIERETARIERARLWEERKKIRLPMLEVPKTTGSTSKPPKPKKTFSKKINFLSC